MKKTNGVAKGLATLFLTAIIGLAPVCASAAPKVIDLRPLLRNGGLNKISTGRVRAVNLRSLNSSHKAPNLRQLNEVGKRLGAWDSGRSGSRYDRGSLHPLTGRDVRDAINYLDRNYGDRRYGDRRYDDRRYDDRYYRDHDPDRAYANAYRDVGIANAVASVVGTIVNSQTVVAGPPAGHYERQRVVLKPGYYEEVREWVPDMTDPRTGDRIMGHYETRQRWTPEVYGYQDVWVP